VNPVPPTGLPDLLANGHPVSDRSGKGYRWTLSSHVRDVSPEDMEAAAKAWSEGS
jgi:hypothetical protein